MNLYKREENNYIYIMRNDPPPLFFPLVSCKNTIVIRFNLLIGPSIYRYIITFIFVIENLIVHNVYKNYFLMGRPVTPLFFSAICRQKQRKKYIYITGT